MIVDQAEADVLYLTNSANFTMSIAASGSMTSDIDINLPPTLGNVSTVLKSNGVGGANWESFQVGDFGSTNINQPTSNPSLDTNINFVTPFGARPTVMVSTLSSAVIPSNFTQRFIGEYVKNVTNTGFTFTSKMLTNIDTTVAPNGVDYSIKTLADGSLGIAYYDNVSTSIKFARSKTNNINLWNIYNIALGGTLCSLVILTNGSPGIFYTNGSNQIQFAYSYLPDGSGKWVIYSVNSLVGANYTAISTTVTANGLPAIVYYDLNNDTLNYSVNSATDGSGTWLSNNVIVGGGSYPSITFSSITKLPIVSYLGSGGNSLYFASNGLVDGTGVWTATLVSSNNPISYTSIKTLNSGFPIISYYYNGGLYFARATNTTGSTWSASVLVNSTNVGTYNELFLFANRVPGIIYYDSAASRLKVAINSNVTGTGTWTVRSLFSVSQGISSVTLTSDGHPVIAYYLSSNLKCFKSVLLNDITIADTPYTINWYVLA